MLIEVRLRTMKFIIMLSDVQSAAHILLVIFIFKKPFISQRPLFKWLTGDNLFCSVNS